MLERIGHDHDPPLGEEGARLTSQRQGLQTQAPPIEAGGVQIRDLRRQLCAELGEALTPR